MLQGFPSGIIIHEDHVFAMDVSNARRARYIAQPYFKRRVRGSSTMTGRSECATSRDTPPYAPGCARSRRAPRMENGYRQIPVLHPERCNLGGTPDVAARKVETACRFRRLRLGKYVSFRNWAVFWLKKK